MADLRPEPALVPVLHLAGNYREVGIQHGRALRGRIHDFLGDRMARLNAVLPIPTSLMELRPRLTEYAEVMAAHVPDLVEELRGLAEGAKISFDSALLLQLRRELAGYSRMPAGGDCTAFCIGQGPEVIAAQTIDLNGGMGSEITVLHIIRQQEGKKWKVLLVSFTGLLGYLGMNDRGLAVCLNLVLGGQWRVGIPGYMAIRHLLNTAASVEEALASLAAMPLASSRSLMLCDRRRKVVVEYTGDEQQLLEGEPLVHANHFLHEALCPLDELNPLAQVFSRQREQACLERLSTFAGVPTTQDCLGLLNTPPIYVPPSRDLCREETVAAVVMRPAIGALWIQPAGSPTAQFVELSTD